MVSVARREKSAHQEDSFDQEPMTAITRRFVTCAFVILFWAPISASSQDISEPEGYRTEDYRAPTPTTLKGARVVTTAEAEQIWKAAGAIFLDVLPYAPRPTNLPPGTIWREKPRRNIPGSSWLPDTGYGALAPVTENYLRTNLAGYRHQRSPRASRVELVKSAIEIICLTGFHDKNLHAKALCGVLNVLRLIL